MSLLPQGNAMPLSRQIAKMRNALAGEKGGGQRCNSPVAEPTVFVVLRDFA